jgi:two-component system chemotaxis response regulator CheY
MKKKVLIVDDSLYMRTMIKDALVDAGYEIVGLASNGENAIDMAFELEPDIITLDNILPDMLGLDVLKTLKEEGITSKVIMISAVGQESIINQSIDTGAHKYLVKPFTIDQLIEIIK